MKNHIESFEHLFFETFWSKKNELKELSNFFDCKVQIYDRIYKNGESAFHGCKFTILGKFCKDAKRKKQLKEYGKKFELEGEFGDFDPVKVKSKGGKNGLPLTSQELKDWEKYGILVQRRICQYKYDNNKKVKEALNSTKNKVLIHTLGRANLEKVSKAWWEGRAVESDKPFQFEIYGKNVLGYIWMEIRDKTKYIRISQNGKLQMLPNYIENNINNFLIVNNIVKFAFTGKELELIYKLKNKKN
jgi:predicted NAD-dependent protein-ADP-ribosyltransferase YbiA (DUF1768 family)